MGGPRRLPPVRLEKGTSGTSWTDSFRDRRAAEEYFEQHGIREAFSEITQELFVHRPGAPFEYIAAALAARAEQQAFRANDVLDTPLPAGEGVRLLRVRVESRSSSGKRAHQQLSSIVPERGPSLPRMLAAAKRKVRQALDQTWASDETLKDALRPSEDEALRATHEGAVSGLDDASCQPGQSVEHRASQPLAVLEAEQAGAAHDRAPTSLPPASVHVRRLLRNKIAADPDAFFEEADADRSDDLSLGEWVTTCQMFAGEGAEPEPALLRELFAEVAGDAGDSATITRERLSEVAQLHRAVRHFVDKAGCADVLVDGIVTSLVRKLRSERPVQEVRVQQGAEGSEGKAASHVLQELLASVCEDDAPVHDVAAALQVQAEIVKAQLAARADAPPPAASDQDDAAKSKFSDLPVSWRCAACAPHSLSSHASDARMRVRCPCFLGNACWGGDLLQSRRPRKHL